MSEFGINDPFLLAVLPTFGLRCIDNNYLAFPLPQSGLMSVAIIVAIRSGGA